MEETQQYDLAVVGGGPAGLTSALYGTRLGLETILFDAGGGRAAMMQETHNVIGVTEEVSGHEFLETGRDQVSGYGGTVKRERVQAIDRVDAADSVEPSFEVTTGDRTVQARRVVLATGFSDKRPDPPLPRTGRGLHYCLHCDAYMFVDEPVYVMGTGDSAAYVAMILLNFTDDVDILTRGQSPAWSPETEALLENHPVTVIESDIEGMNTRDDGWLESFTFEDGSTRQYRGGFPMYGAEYNTDLAESIGVTFTESGEIETDDHGRTDADGVFAVGDVTPGHNQIPVAMGQGAKAGIAIHKELRAFPRTDGTVDPEEVPAMDEASRAIARSHHGHAGGPRED